jgi:uncharacterized protein YdhG (YjbR/CyaY superfamily)
MTSSRTTGAIDHYIAKLPEPRRARGEAVHRLVMKLFPKALSDFGYTMPTYYVGEHFFAWGNKKNYLSVYTCSAVRIAAFTAKHPNVPSGVGCVNFRDRDPFPLRDLTGLIRNALAPSSTILKRERHAGKKTRR